MAPAEVACPVIEDRRMCVPEPNSRSLSWWLVDENSLGFHSLSAVSVASEMLNAECGKLPGEWDGHGWARELELRLLPLSLSLLASSLGSVSLGFLIYKIGALRPSSWVVGENVNSYNLCGESPVWRFLKKLKIQLPYDPAVPLLGIYIWRKSWSQRIHAPHCWLQHCFTIAKKWKQPKMSSTEEWIKKMRHTYIQ